MNSPDSFSEKLPRTLGLWGIWLLVVNGLVGAGIFGLPSGAAKLAGEYSIFVYGICALLILPVILSFAELSSYFKGTGGPIRYATAAFGNFVGFQSGWLFYVARMVSFAANSVLLVDSIGYFWPAVTAGIGRGLLLGGICGGLTLINILGTLQSIRSLAGMTVVKFLVLILLVVTGVTMLGADVIPALDTPIPSGTDIGAATLLLIYAFVGFESAVVPAGEARNPSRDMPRALLLGIGMIAILYVMIQVVSIAVIPDIGNSTTPLLDVAAELMGPTGAIILMIGVVASVGANLFGAIFSSPRVTYALALDNNLPAWFGKVHPKFLTPANSILVYGIGSFLLAVFGSFIWLAAANVLSRLLMYILSCAAIPKLRPKIATKESFVLPWGYVIPVLGILSCIWLMFQVSMNSILLTLLFIVIGTILYFLARRSDIK